MNEQEWLTSEDPAAMLSYLTGKHVRGGFGLETHEPPSDRKFRLFACAYCRAKGVAPDLVDRLEQNGSDAFASDWRWAAAIIENSTTEPRLLASLLREVVGNPWRPVTLPKVRSLVVADVGSDYSGPATAIVERCPWLTPDVLEMARHAYDARDFAGLPVLADALEEAGCDSEHLLRHLRGEELVPSPHMPKLGLWQPQRSPHVRGCFTVDLILGKK